MNGTKQSASNFHSGGATGNVSCVMSPETRATIQHVFVKINL